MNIVLALYTEIPTGTAAELLKAYGFAFVAFVALSGIANLIERIRR